MVARNLKHRITVGLGSVILGTILRKPLAHHSGFYKYIYIYIQIDRYTNKNLIDRYVCIYIHATPRVRRLDLGAHGPKPRFSGRNYHNHKNNNDRNNEDSKIKTDNCQYN